MADNPWEVASEAPAQTASQPSSDNQWQVAGQSPSSSGQPPVPEASVSDQLAQQEKEVGTGFVKGIGNTVSGIGSLIRGGIGAASAISPTRAGAYLADKTGLDPGAYEKEEQERQRITDQAKETLVPSEGHSALDTLSTPHGTGEWIGYGGETLSEFLLGDEALKGMSLADKFKQISQVAGIFEKSKRMMRMLQLGVDVSKAAGQLGPEELAAVRKSPILAHLVGAGMDAVRQGAVQGTETTVKTGGDLKQAAKEGGTMAGISALVGLPLAAAGGVLSKVGELGRTMEVAKQGQEAAQSVATGTEAAQQTSALGNTLQATKPVIEAPAPGVVSPHADIVSGIKKATDSVEDATHKTYEQGINKISADLAGKTINLDDSPLAKAAKEAQDALRQEPKGLTERLGKSLQGMIPGTERGEKMAGTLLGQTEQAAEDKTPSWLLGEEVKTGSAGTAPIKPTEENLTADNLINYRQRLRKLLPQMAYDDPNKQVIYKLMGGVDDTIQKMADDAGNPQTVGDYKALREQYKNQIQFFDPKSAKAASNPIRYQVAQKLQSGTLNDAPQFLLGGNNSLAKVRAAKDLLGDESIDNLAAQTIRRWAQDAMDPGTGQVNAKKLIDHWNRVPSDTRNEFFTQANSGYRSMIEDLSQSPDANKQTLARLNKLIRFGVFPVAGAISGEGLKQMTGDERAPFYGALAGALYGGGRREVANDLVKFLSEHPDYLSATGKGGALGKTTSLMRSAVTQQAAQSLSSQKPALANVLSGASEPLSNGDQGEQ